MNLSAERKIKFWLSTIVKFLIGVLVLFKISTYFFKDNGISMPNDETSTLKEINSESINDSLKTVAKITKQEDGIIEDKISKQPNKITKPITKDLNLEKLILNPSLKNSIDSKDMAIFVFGDDLQLNNNLISQLQNTIFNDYNTTTSLVLPNEMSESVKQNLMSGNIAVLGQLLEKYTDYVCVGNVNTTFRKSSVNSEITICDLELNIAIYDSKGVRQRQLSKSDTYIGQGFTKQEAQKNAMKRIE